MTTALHREMLFSPTDRGAADGGFMNANKPAGGDLPLRFYDEQPFKVEVSDQLLKVNCYLAEHNLEVILKRVLEDMFEEFKKQASQSPEKARAMDDLVHDLYDDQPSALAEWEAFIKMCEIADEEIEEY
jgi:hypothetical protein